MFMKRKDLLEIQGCVDAKCSVCGSDRCGECGIDKSKKLIEWMLEEQDDKKPTMDEYYDYASDNVSGPKDPEKVILYAIVGDLMGRGGEEFGSYDPETQEEILGTWLEIIRTGER